MLFSVIIPIYNAEKTLHRCLESLIPQLSDCAELILIDDGSSDRSADICREYAEQYSGIRFFSKKNGGVSSARNVGIAAVTGKYVTFVDSDDYVSPNYFDCLMTYPDVDLLFFSAELMHGERKSSFISTQPLASCADYPQFLKAFVAKRNGSPCNKRFRADIINNNQLRFPENIFIGEDFVFCMRYLMAAQSGAAIDDVLYHVDETGGNSLSRRYNPDVIKQALLNYEYSNRAVAAAESDLIPKEELFQLLDYNRCRTAFACVMELFKKKHRSFLRIRPIILLILSAFQVQNNPIPAINQLHNMMRYCINHRCAFAAYCIGYCRFCKKRKH